MTDPLVGWCCIGCGKVEVPRPCIGVCEDRKCELVRSADYDEALGQVAAVHRQVEALSGLARRLAWATPRDGEWERSHRTLQAQARSIMDSLAEAKNVD